VRTVKDRHPQRNRPTRVPATVWAVAIVAGVALGGCTGSDGGATNTTVEFTPADVPAGAAQTPFCSGMSAISLRVNTDPPSDINGYLVAEYEALLPVVPDAIASEFRTVLANLRAAADSSVGSPTGSGPSSGPSSGTTAPSTDTSDPSDGFAEEGYLPDAEPNLRLNAYLADNCFGTQSNPGPPPTQPFSDVPAPSDPSTTAVS
jgi:hypothetical protein